MFSHPPQVFIYQIRGTYCSFLNSVFLLIYILTCFLYTGHKSNLNIVSLKRFNILGPMYDRLVKKKSVSDCWGIAVPWGISPVSLLFASGGQTMLQLYHQSFQWIVRIDFLWDWLVWCPCRPRDSQESFLGQFESISSLALSFLYSPTLISVQDYWKKP